MNYHDYSRSEPSIGSGIAERDSRFLSDEFIDIPAYDFIKDLDIIFITGKKGIGKSAIALKYVSSNESDYCRVLPLKPHEEGKGFVTYALSLDEVRKQTKHKLSKMDINKKAWRLFYIVNIMIDILDRADDLSVSAMDDDLKQMQRYLEKNNWYNAGDYEKFFAITSIIDKILNTFASMFGGATDIDITRSALDHVIFGDSHRQAECSLKRVLDKMPGKYCVFVDGLDEALEHRGKIQLSELTDFVDSFIETTDDLSYPLFHDNLVLKAFVPKDFFEKSSFRQKDKANLCAKEILWRSDKKDDLIIARLRTNLKPNVSADMSDLDVQIYFFKDEMHFVPLPGYRGKVIDIPVWKFIRQYTITPRDYIHLCKNIFHIARSQSEEIISNDTVIKAIRKYSTTKCLTLIDEIGYTYSAVREVIMYFNHGDRFHDVSELYKSLLEKGILLDQDNVDIYLQCLYAFGFLGIVRALDDGSSERPLKYTELYYDENPTLYINTEELVCVNRAFCPYLNIKKYIGYEYW